MASPNLEPGDLVVGWPPPTDEPYAIRAVSPAVGPKTPGIVVRTHRIKLLDNSETQEVWILREGQEERWLASELRLLTRA